MSVFHEGELRVQEQAGVREAARRLTPMLDSPDLSGGMSAFLAQRTFAVIAARDGHNRLWASALRAAPGFLTGADHTLRVGVAPGPGDPLYRLPAGQPVGMIAIEFAARRRVRVNGRLTSSDPDHLVIDVDQAYGNCPQYIRRRTLSAAASPSAGDWDAPTDHLDDADRALISAADTLFLGTSHPRAGVDASHRGGPPGFVDVDGDDVWWPDFPGNNMFNSLGNLAVDPAAALLFVDWLGGGVLAISGTARVSWTGSAGTGRTVRFHTEAVARGRVPALRAEDVQRGTHST